MGRSFTGRLDTMSRQITLEQDIERLLEFFEVKNEDGDRLNNLEDEGRDCKDWVSISKSDLKELLRNMRVCGAFL